MGLGLGGVRGSVDPEVGQNEIVVIPYTKSTHVVSKMTQDQSVHNLHESVRLIIITVI